MIRVGVDYYPEHWDPSMWESDVRLMKESGVNVVRLAEFAWSRMEPAEGRFEFEWLDRAIALFESRDIAVVLGVPTMTPPTWLIRRYPDALPVLPEQHLSNPGVRGHRCYNSPSMRERTRIIAERMAERYGGREAVIGWQTDNEFSLHMCRCESCKTGFVSWLKKKYGTLEQVNREWGTVVWSGEFTEWEQIALYQTSERYFNPSLLLDFRRFQSESVVSFQQIQVEAIRSRCPGQFITHNAWSAPLPLDYAALYEPLDFAAIDYYPATSPDKAASNPYSGALLLDRTRGFKKRNFWVMEQLGGPPGSWMPIWRSPYPGALRAYAWQSVSRGADGVVFFRWRSGIAGAEQFWHGLIDHSNVPGRRFAEFQQFCREANRLSDRIFGTVPNNQVGILYDFDSHTALQLQPQAEGLDYYEHIKSIHRAVLKLGIGVDIVHGRTPSLDGYRMLIVPALFVADRRTAEWLEAFVEEGGIVIATPRTGVKRPNNQIYMEMLPGPLSRLFGVQVGEYDAIGMDAHGIKDRQGRQYGCLHWNDLLEIRDAEALAVYSGDFYDGTPAVTVRGSGKGKAVYIGTYPDEEYYREFFATLAEEGGIEYTRDLPEGVHISRREREGETLTFVLNLSRETRTVVLAGPCTGLLRGEEVQGELVLGPYELEVLTGS